MVKDPICGMEIEPQLAAATREYMGQTFYFCSTQCAEAFDANPHQYMHQETAVAPKPTVEQVIDPVCGMAIDPESAAATRQRAGETFYFCSTRCAETFDAGHVFLESFDQPPVGSATTGVNPGLPLAQVDLPIVGLKNGSRQALESVLRRIPGVSAATVNGESGVARIAYDPDVVSTEELAAAMRLAGYHVGGAETRIGVENLRCASCIGFIEDELRATPGVLNASVNIATQEATVKYLPEKTTLAQLNQAVESWGYKVRPAVSEEPVDDQQAAHEQEYRRLMKRFWFAAVLSVPTMALAYIPLPESSTRLIWAITAVFMLPVMFWSGSDFFTGAWAALKHRTANMNTLIALGTSAAWLYSAAAIAFPGVFPEGTAEPFFDVVAVVIALVVLGQALEIRAKGRSSRVVQF